MIFAAILIYLAKLLGGFLLADLIWTARDGKALTFKVFLGLGLGTGLSSVLYFLWLWVRFPAGAYPYVELGLLVVLAAVSVALRPFFGPKAPALLLAAPSRNTLLWAGLAALAVIFCVTGFFLDALQNPHGVQDAWTIWNVSARFIYGAPATWLTIVPQDVWFHADYPLLLSLNVAEGWSIVGSDTTRIPIVVALTFLVGTIGLLYAALAIAKDREQGLLAVIIISSPAALWGLAATQYADVPLAYFFLATGALLYIYTMDHETRLLVLAGLLAGFGAWTKNEGVTFALLCLLGLFLLSLQEKKNLVKYFLLGVALPVLAIILFKTITPPNDLFFNITQRLLQLFDPSRYLTIFSYLVSSILTFGAWPVSFLLVFAIYAAVTRANPSSARGRMWLPFAIILLQCVCYFVIYLITPRFLAGQLRDSLDRLIFQIFPLALFLVLIQLLSPSELLPEKS